MADEEILFNPYLPEFHADPYPFYRRLREQDPVHRTPLGFVVLTRYEDVQTLLRDQRFGRDGMDKLFIDVYGDVERLPASMLFRDPPDHTRLRALVSKAFTPRVVEQMRRHIEEIVARLVERARPGGRMDVIADLAYPLPVTVISEMLGVPAGDHEVMKGWSADIARSLDAFGLPSDQDIVERGRVARHAVGEYFRGLLAERRRRPGGDLLSLLIAAEEQGDRLSEGELLSTCVLLYIAGHETTVNLIGNGLLALLRHPDQMRRLRDDPRLVPAAVEELLRYDSPVQRTARLTHADVELGGRRIDRGTMVVGCIGAANRDPAQFADPDRLDVGRREVRHLSFGSGIHFCLGAPLARIEGQAALDTLLRRLPPLELAAEPTWRESSILRGLRALPVAW